MTPGSRWGQASHRVYSGWQQAICSCQGCPQDIRGPQALPEETTVEQLASVALAARQHPSECPALMAEQAGLGVFNSYHILVVAKPVLLCLTGNLWHC